MKDFLIASHVLGGISGFNVSQLMNDREMIGTVNEVMRVTEEIKRQVADGPGRLIVAHLLGGTSGIRVSPPQTDQQIEAMVSLATRVLKEIEKQVDSKH
jgi:hypothetical protein